MLAYKQNNAFHHGRRQRSTRTGPGQTLQETSISAAPHAQHTTPADVAAPPERFNFAQHLLDVNAGRPDT
ncbi:MAG: hypothetical protein KDF67_10875, partial [Ottowia sp.]|nr:hypothetical protein [Ottowia sp.]